MATQVYSIRTAVQIDKERNYATVVTIDHMPDGPLRSLIRTTRVPPLSPFQPRRTGCILVVCSPDRERGGTPLKPSDLPWLAGFLIQNKYIIDYELTRSLQPEHVQPGVVRLVWCIRYTISGSDLQTPGL
jgi:hypothetical protein